MMPKLYCTTGTARLLIASILFLPLNSYYNNNNYYHYSFLPSFLILLHSRMAKIKFGLGHVLKLIKLEDSLSDFNTEYNDAVKYEWPCCFKILMT